MTTKSQPVMPSWRLLDKRHPKAPSGYVKHEATDIRKTFAKARAALNQLKENA